MKKVTTFYVLLLTLFLVNTISVQNPEWINYTCGKIVTSVAIEDNTVWAGTEGGLVQLDMNSENIIYYNKANSGLPDNSVYSIAIDGSGNRWIGIVYGGLAKFDDTNWNVYNTSNSGLPYYNVRSIAIDVSGNKWIGTGGGGLAKFDGTNWTVYNTSNSGLPDNYVESIAIDGSGNKWIGTWVQGLRRGMNGALTKFDGTNWTVYKTSNSALPCDCITSITINGSGHKWVGTNHGGLAVYREGGVVAVEENPVQAGLPRCFMLEPNFPNPFNTATIISFTLAKPSSVCLSICDLLGRKVCTLLNEKRGSGGHKIMWKAQGVSSGIYICRLETETGLMARKVILLK